jgi:hypothetical protein
MKLRRLFDPKRLLLVASHAEAAGQDEAAMYLRAAAEEIINLKLELQTAKSRMIRQDETRRAEK